MAGRLALLLAAALMLGAPWGARAQHEPAESKSSAPAAASETGHAPAASHAEQPNILEIQPTLATWTAVVFVVLMLVLWKFAWGPLSKALHDREHFMEDSLHRAEQARAEGERLLAEHRKLMQEANAQAQSILDEARKGALVAAESVRKTAQTEAEATLDRARREIASAKDQAMLEIWNKSADLAVSVAGKVLDRELSPDDHRRLIDQAMAELPVTAGATTNGRGA
jgi:F-type H+-transporting ATPase subunit b